MKKKLRFLSFIVGIFVLSVSGYAQYCTTGLYTTGCSFGDDLDDVTIGSFVQTATGCSTGGYADYTGDTITIAQATPTTIAISSNFSSQFYALWIDFNNDGDFDDATEFVWSTSTGLAGVNTSFVLPLVSTGTYRMRLRGQYASQIGATQSCTSFTYGEVHDYMVEVTPPPACPDPFSFSVLSLSSSSATFSFSSPGNLFYVEYGPCGFTQGTGSVDTITSTTFTISNLASSTEYDVYVMSDCSASGNGFSGWANTGCVKTDCSAQSTPFAEGFESATAGSSVNSTVPDCWKYYESPGAVGYGYTANSTTNARTGSKHFYMYTSSNQTNGDTMGLVSPEVAGMTTTDKRIEFWSRAYFSGATYDAELIVGTVNSPYEMGSFVPIDTFHIGDNVIYQHFVSNITVANGYNGVHQYIAIMDNSDINDYVFIDDISISDVPACIPSTGLTAGNITNVSADISWVAGQGLAYNIEYGPTGFTQGTGPIITGITDTNYTLTGLAGSICYDVYVRDSCANGKSPWFGPITVCTECNPVSTPLFEDFEAAAAGSTINPSEPDCWSFVETSGAPGYGYTYNSATYANSGTKSFRFYSSSNPTNGDMQALVSPEIAGMDVNNKRIDFWARSMYTGTTYNVKVAVGTVSTPGNLASFVPLDTVVIGDNNVYQQITMFFTASSGYNGTDRYIALLDASDATDYLLIDDINISDVPNCIEPTQITASSVQGYQADISWVNAGAGTQFEIEYGLQGFVQATGGGIRDTVSTASTTLFGLTPVTCYDVYVRTFCGATDSSIWTGPFSFCTTVSCPEPTAINLVSVTTTTANISWSTGGASNYDYVVGVSGTTPGTGTVVSGGTSIPLAIIGLTPSTTYDFWLRDSCGQGDVSTWAGPFSFVTACVAFTAPFTEDFGTSGAAPICWSNYNTTGNTSANTLWRNTSANWGNYGAQGVVDHTGNGSYAMGVDASTPYLEEPMLETPLINMSALTSPELRFWMFRNNTNLPGSHNDFQVDFFDGTSWNDSIYGYADDSSAWVEHVVDLSTFTVTGDVKIRFRIYKVGTPVDFYDDTMIDDISVDNTPACPSPTLLSAANISSTSADLSWTAGTTGATSWDIEYGQQGFVLGSGTSVSGVTSNTYALTGLTSATAYCYYIREACTGGTQYSNYAGPFCFTTSCVTATMPFIENWSNWTPPAAPVCWDDQGGNQTVVKNGNTVEFDFYGWFSNENAYLTSPAITISQKAKLTISWSSTLYAFAEDTVLIYAKPTTATTWDLIDTWASPDCLCGATNTTPSATPIDSVYSLDSNYVGSDIQIRIVGNSDFGNDVFIHSISVDADIFTCSAPANAMAQNVTCDEMEIAWTSDTATLVSHIEYGVSGYTPGSGTAILGATSPQVITGLSQNTAYDVYLIDSCSTGLTLPALVTATTTGNLTTAAYTWSQSATTMSNATIDFDASASTNGTTYTWDFGDGSAAGTGVMPTHQYAANGSYYATVTVDGGCGTVVFGDTVLVMGISIEESMLNQTLNVFPNPNNGNFRVQFQVEGLNDVSIRVLSLLGQEIYHNEPGKITGQYQQDIDLGKQAAGIYVLQIISDGNVVSRRITIQK